MLKDAPELEAKSLFEWLCEQKPGQYQEGQLRTFQRRVSTWRVFNEDEPDPGTGAPAWGDDANGWDLDDRVGGDHQRAGISTHC